MLVVPASANISARTHIIETPDDVIVNSQVYNKTTLKPEPYSFFPENFGANGNKNILYHECNATDEALQCAHYREPDEPVFVRDNRDFNVFYYIHRNGSNLNISKARKVNRQYSIDWTIAPASGYAPISRYSVHQYNYKYLGQNDEYIIYAEKIGVFNSNNTYNSNIGVTGISIIRVVKSTGVVAYCNVNYCRDTRVQTIYADDNYIFLYMNLGGAIEIYRYSIPTNDILNIFKDCLDYQDTNCIGVSNIIKFRNNFYVITCDSSRTGYAFQKLTINYDTHEVTRKECPFNTVNDFPFHLHGDATLNYGWLLFTLRNINNEYIGVTAHDNMNQPHRMIYSNTYAQTFYSAKGWHRSMVVKYRSSDDTFIPVCTVPVDNPVQHFYGVLYYDDYHLLIYMNDKVQGWRFDPEDEQFYLYFERVGAFAQVGFDEVGRLYLCDTNNKVSITTKTSVGVIYVNFAEDSYYYNGVEIATSCFVYTKNFLDEYVEATIKLTAFGSCVFDNGTNETIVNTKSSGSISVPVMIIGSGDIGIQATEVEGNI